jgi:hypothetical protein
MAIPPEPLITVLPQAVSIVVAEVVSVENRKDGLPRSGKQPPSAPKAVGSQLVKLKVTQVLRGSAVTELTVVKPVGEYALRAGNHGAFLLDGDGPPEILGRYGPDSYRLADIEAALAKSH